MKRILLTLFLIFPLLLHAQHLKIYGGPMSNSFTSKGNFSFLTEKLVTLSGGLGVDYFSKKWGYLSSQVGYMKFGGQETNEYNFPVEKFEESAGFLSMHTTLRVKVLKDNNTNVYVGTGPYFNILNKKNKAFKSDFYKDDYSFNNSHWGAITEIGISLDIKRVKFGLNAAYLFSLSPTINSFNSSSGSSKIKTIRNNSFTNPVSISVGYKLNKTVLNAINWTLIVN